MFDLPQNVHAVTLVMRGPVPWGYFGLNSVALLVAPGPTMLVSGRASEEGELCLAATATGVALSDCLGAIASGLGNEVFSWNEDSQLVASGGQSCLSLASGDAVGGGRLVLQDCAEAMEAGDGRSTFELTAQGQLKLTHMGNYCVVASPASARVEDCETASEAAEAADKFFPAAVAEFDARAAMAAQDTARLVQAAAARQGQLLTRLQDALPKLQTCKLAFARDATRAREALSLAQGARYAGARDTATAAVQRIETALPVDLAAVKGLLAATQQALAKAGMSQ